MRCGVGKKTDLWPLSGRGPQVGCGQYDAWRDVLSLREPGA
jgi:hypothetical protein